MMTNVMKKGKWIGSEKSITQCILILIDVVWLLDDSLSNINLMKETRDNSIAIRR